MILTTFVWHSLWIRHYSKHFTDSNLPNFWCLDIAREKWRVGLTRKGVLSGQYSKGQRERERRVRRSERVTGIMRP